MSSLREAAGLAQAAIYETLKHADAMDSAEERRHALSGACAESEAGLNKATAELKVTQSELAQVKGQLAAKSRILDDLRARSDAELDARIVEAQGQRAILEDKINKARQAIKDTDASTDSLIRRLRIG